MKSASAMSGDCPARIRERKDEEARMTRTVLRGAYALLGSGFDFERRPLDVLVDGERISAIEPANSIHDAGAVIDLTGQLPGPGSINGHMHSHEPLHRRRTGQLPRDLP